MEDAILEIAERAPQIQGMVVEILLMLLTFFYALIGLAMSIAFIAGIAFLVSRVGAWILVRLHFRRLFRRPKDKR